MGLENVSNLSRAKHRKASKGASRKGRGTYRRTFSVKGSKAQGPEGFALISEVAEKKMKNFKKKNGK